MAALIASNKGLDDKVAQVNMVAAGLLQHTFKAFGGLAKLTSQGNVLEFGRQSNQIIDLLLARAAHNTNKLKVLAFDTIIKACDFPLIGNQQVIERIL